MATYIQRDIKCYDDGELDISSGGIELATVRQSQRQLILTLLNTTRGDFLHDVMVGWGADTYMGRVNNPITHQVMTDDLKIMFGKTDDLANEDIFFTVSWVDHETAAIVLRHEGVFIEQDGTISTGALVLGWKYAFLTGQIEVEE